MKLEEAIDLLGIEDRRSYPKRRLEAHLAIKLSIEGLQRIQVGRNNPGSHWNDPLPGETIE